MAFMQKGGKANDKNTAPKSAKDPTPEDNTPTPPKSDAFGDFKLKEKVVIASLNNAVGTITQLTNHAGKPVAEVRLPNGKTDWVTLKEIAAVPADTPPDGGIPASDPSMPPAQAETPQPPLSA
jgi:hypothetical protein